jgi:hypothetical protein
MEIMIPDPILTMVQVLSMSRLGGAAAVAPLVASMSSEVLHELPFWRISLNSFWHTSLN